MEIDGIGETHFVAKVPATHFEQFDARVDAFSRSIIHFEHDSIQAPPQVRFDGSCRCFDGFQTTAHGLRQPQLPLHARPDFAHVVPLWLGQFFDGPGTCRLQGALTQCFEALLAFARHVCRVVEPVMFAALERFATLRHQRLVFLATRLVDRITEMLSIDARCSWGRLAYCDTSVAFVRSSPTCSTYPMSWSDTIVTSLPECRLIITQMHNCAARGCATQQTSRNRALHHPIDRIPTQPHYSRDRRDRGLFQPIDH
jgi:hypothetical protein